MDILKTESHLFSKCLPIFLAATLTGLGCGCETAKDYSLTYKVWDNDERSYCEPLANPDLTLFEVESKHDVLVQYTAISDRHDGTLRRSYFLKASGARIAAGKSPHFVRVKPGRDWKAIPINGRPPLANYSVSTNIYAKATGKFFTLYRQGRQSGRHQLPDYRDDHGAWERAALTPFAATGDVVMLGAVVGFVAGYEYLQSGGPIR